MKTYEDVVGGVFCATEMFWNWLEVGPPGVVCCRLIGRLRVDPDTLAEIAALSLQGNWGMLTYSVISECTFSPIDHWDSEIYLLYSHLVQYYSLAQVPKFSLSAVCWLVGSSLPTVCLSEVSSHMLSPCMCVFVFLNVQLSLGTMMSPFCPMATRGSTSLYQTRWAGTSFLIWACTERSVHVLKSTFLNNKQQAHITMITSSWYAEFAGWHFEKDEIWCSELFVLFVPCSEHVEWKMCSSSDLFSFDIWRSALVFIVLCCVVKRTSWEFTRRLLSCTNSKSKYDTDTLVHMHTHIHTCRHFAVHKDGADQLVSAIFSLLLYTRSFCCCVVGCHNNNCAFLCSFFSKLKFILCKSWLLLVGRKTPALSIPLSLSVAAVQRKRNSGS